MLIGVGSVAVLVNDADKAARWYRDKLGFEIVENKGHAVWVRPKGTTTPLLHLCERCDDWGDDKPGGRTGIWLASGKVRLRRDKKSGRILPSSNPRAVERTYKELKRKGVEFSQELTKTSWGKMAILRDLDGNEFEIS
ncbi:MAG TPA: VOC family protein [Nitrososphaerales archaeon]|nr:VOC family protein [Nitrososphaerales archaeon]HUK75905.1 VOC family protein [Nitrososphaerales archaeon]